MIRTETWIACHGDGPSDTLCLSSGWRVAPLCGAGGWDKLGTMKPRDWEVDSVLCRSVVGQN
eukprot:9136155-Pyramimonas_sp.AAC.1